MQKPRLSFGRFGVTRFWVSGIQFGDGELQLGNMSAIDEKLEQTGYSPILWLACCCRKLRLQPIIGLDDDCTWGRLGRRRSGTPGCNVSAVSACLLYVIFIVDGCGLLWILTLALTSRWNRLVFVADKSYYERTAASSRSFFIGLGGDILQLAAIGLLRIRKMGALRVAFPDQIRVPTRSSGLPGGGLMEDFHYQRIPPGRHGGVSADEAREARPARRTDGDPLGCKGYAH